ncbi:MAG: GNAT family N-acetyltransferase [Candidatus Taylorbacteria bacterium]
MSQEGLEPNKLKISLKPEDMVGKFHVEEENKKNTIREDAKKRLIGGLSRGYLDYVEKSLEGVDNVRAEDEDIDNYQYDRNDDDWEWEKRRRLSNIPDEVKDSPEVIQAATEGMMGCLSNGDIEQATEIKNIFSIPTEIIYHSTELHAIQEALARRLSHEDNDGVIELINNFFPARSAEGGLSPEFEQTFKKILGNLISDGYVDRAIEIKHRLYLSQSIITSSEIQDSIKKQLIYFFQRDDIRGAEHLKEQFSITANVLASSEVQEIVKHFVAYTLSKEYYNDIGYAREICGKFSLSSENVMQAATEGLIARLSKGDIHRASEIRQEFSISPETITSPTVQQAARQGMLDLLLDDKEYRSIEHAIAIKDQFAILPESLASPETQRVCQKVVVRYLSSEYPQIDEAIKFRNQFGLSDSATRQAAEEGMIAQIKRNSMHDAEKIKNKFFSSGEEALSPEVQEAVKQAMIRTLLAGENAFITETLRLKMSFALPTEVLSSSEVQQAAERAMLKCLTNGEVLNTVRIKNSFSLPTEVTSSHAVQLAARAGMAKCLAKGNAYNTSDVDEIRNMFSLSVENTQLAAKEGMMAQLANGNIAGAESIQEKFSISQEIIVSDEVRKAATEGVSRCLLNGSVDDVLKIIDKFSLPIEYIKYNIIGVMTLALASGTERMDVAIEIKSKFPSLVAEITTSYKDTQEAANEGLFKYISYGHIDSAYFNRISSVMNKFSLRADYLFSPKMQKIAIKKITDWISARNGRDVVMQIKDQFLLPDEAVHSAVIDGMVNLLSSGQIDYAEKVKDQYSLSAENLLKAAKQAFLKCLADDKNERAEQIKEKFKVSVSSEDILEYFPEIRTLLSELRTISPDFATQAEKTPDLLLSLLEFRKNPKKIIDIATQNPFLLEAVASNPRFGSRLLIKYPQFDRISKENITTQCAAKKKIMTEHPDIDPQSVEFRMLMQDTLLAFGKNKEVVADIDSKGLSSERWLNYDETASFNLGSNENTLAFSEIITTPINRIKETIDTYAYTIKEVLSEYRVELIAFEIALGGGTAPTDELQKMMTALEKAKSEGNAKRVAGIEKGIENLKAKSSQERKGVLWEKLLADVASFQRLKDDIFKAQEIFASTEKELENAITEKMPSGKKIQEIKRKMAVAKEDLRAKFTVMERRIEEFRASLQNMIAPALSSERASALVQDINTRLAEQFNHFDADRSMLKNLFGEQSDKKKEEMESRPMSIFVWTRDPDVDLYQGNYSPCCICIDSTYHGAESPIADYNTDLGIQIVNVWDETKNEPVTAAWCWLGEDENGEPALVVDNIEANTLFSANFSEQFTNELFKYIKEYAKAVGVKKVVLGKANNDLPTAGELSKLPENVQKYTKIGGANRSDGYFLEAESSSVKVIWEKGVKSSTKKAESKTKKSEAERVVFSEVNAYALTEPDFRSMRELERRVYVNDSELIQGLELVRDINEGNGLEYSVAIWGVPEGSTKQEMIAYAVAVEDETDEGDKSVYLEDIAVAPEAQRQGVGRKIIQELVQRLKAKATTLGEPVLFDMHLRPNSLAMLDTQRETFAGIGVVPIEEVLVPDYYDEGEDAVYRVYEVMPSSQN